MFLLPCVCLILTASIIRFSGLSLKAGDGKADPKDGFPEAALAAQLAGDLTKAKKPTTKNSLGLSVE